MRRMRPEDTAGVTEVLGTILILAMTVVLFSGIIVWVSQIPTPVAATRMDVLPRMEPIYNVAGVEIGVSLTLVHTGGEPLLSLHDVLYVISQRGSNPPQTDTVPIHLYNSFLVSPNGLLDGQDTTWDIGERWAYKNYALRSSDDIKVTIVDTEKNLVVWSGSMNARVGTRPPVFVDKWADGLWISEAPDPVQANIGFYIFAKVADPDRDLNPASVYAVLTAWYGSAGPCEMPWQMLDDGVFPDRAAGDQIFSLGANLCMDAPYPGLSWAGSIILLNATDFQGHRTTTRFVLDVVAQTTGLEAENIPSQLWQYIGFVQIRSGEIWISNLNNPYSTTITFLPYRVTRDQMNANGGPLFHLQMSNHGNRTIFLDGWTLVSFSAAARSSVFGMYIVKKVDPIRPANAGGIAAYPGSGTQPNNFQYADVLDVDLQDQEKGGPSIVVLAAAKTSFKSDWPQNFIADNFFVNVLISGIAGPTNMTYVEIITRWGPTYNPFDHLYDADPTTKTQWYGQVIPFIGMTVY